MPNSKKKLWTPPDQTHVHLVGGGGKNQKSMGVVCSSGCFFIVLLVLFLLRPEIVCDVRTQEFAPIPAIIFAGAAAFTCFVIMRVQQ